MTVTTMATVAAQNVGVVAMTSTTTMTVSACFAISTPILYTMKSNTKSFHYFIRCMQPNLPAICKCFSDSQLVYLSKIPRNTPHLSKLDNYSDRCMKQHQQTITSTNTAEFWRDLENNSLLPSQFVNSSSNESINLDKTKTITIIMSDHNEMKGDSSNSAYLMNTEIRPKEKLKLNNSVVTPAYSNKTEQLSTIPELLKALQYLKKIAIHNQSQQYSSTKIQGQLTDAHVGDSGHKVLLQSVDKTLSPIVIVPLVKSPRNTKCGSKKILNSNFSRNSNNINTAHVSRIIAKKTKNSLVSFSMYTQTNVAFHDTSKINQPRVNELLTDPWTIIFNKEKTCTTPGTTIANEVNKTVSIQAVTSTSISPMKSLQTIKILLTVPNQLSAEIKLASSSSGSKEVAETFEPQLTLHSIPTLAQVIEGNNSKHTANEHCVFMEPVIEEMSNSSDEIKVESPMGSEKVQRKRDSVQNKNNLNRTSPSTKPLSKIKSFFMSLHTNQINQNQLQTTRRSIMSSIRNITSSIFQNHEPDLEKEQREKEKEESIYEEEYDKIYNDSREKAYEKAYNDAYKSIVNSLYNDAYIRAYNDAYESARKEASLDAYSDIHNDVFNDAYEKVYQIACDEAYAKAVKEAREKAFKDIHCYYEKKYKK